MSNETKSIGQEAAEKYHHDVFWLQKDERVKLAEVIDKIVRERGEADTKRLDWMLANAICVWNQDNQTDTFGMTTREAIDADMKAEPKEEK